jgi:hypothetical protein
VKAIALLALSCSLSLALSACASDQVQIQDTNDASAGPNHDASNGPGADSGGPPAPLTCSSACQTDIECQNRCPQLDSGMYCCDLSHVCYPSASTCPTGTPDGASNLPD